MRVLDTNGLELDSPRNGFYLMETPEGIGFTGDEVFSRIEGHLLKLHAAFENRLFPNGDYGQFLESAPPWIWRAGIDPESTVGKVDFERLLKMNGAQLTHQLLLAADQSTLISGLQDRVWEIKALFGRFYLTLCKIEKFDSTPGLDGTFVLHGSRTVALFSVLENLFVKTYAVFDLLAKIVCEANSHYKDFGTWPKMKGKNVLYGDGNRFIGENTSGTVFEKSPTVNAFVALRNEIIHNGTFAYQNKVYFRYRQGNLKEKFVLMMDLSVDGIVSVKNRKRFYSSEQKIKKINEILPGMVMEIADRIETTVVKAVALVA